MNLSACLVIHNEEEVLERCLNSLKGLVDEIIIVHDGICTDKSLEISKKFKARIYIRPFIGEAEYHRPFTFQKARGDWILHLDADEILSNNLIKNLPELLKFEEFDAFSFAWPYPDDHGLIKKGPFSQTVKPALFKKKSMYMIGLSHEYPRTFGKLCRRSDLLIIHKPLYDNFNVRVFKSKWNKWARLHAAQLRDLFHLPVFNIQDKNENKLYAQHGEIYCHPLLTGIKQSLKFISIFLTRNIIFAGSRSWKIAIMELSYIWLLRYYIVKLKND